MVCIIYPVLQNLLTCLNAQIFKWRGDLLSLSPTTPQLVVLNSHLNSLLQLWRKFEAFWHPMWSRNDGYVFLIILR